MNLGAIAFYAVAAAAVLLGVCMLLGAISGQMAEGLSLVFIGLMAALWARANGKALGS
ncbi:hypothetical protein [Phenylobacterium soli]|uniref:hypothetical protein n=1 Tax=Phenylobacterium soli TaxID=2170551 RepID=UPI0014037CE2|nr:hypothetical protein [Phenylobacterium soli]